MGKRDSTRFGFDMSVGRISYIAQLPCIRRFFVPAQLRVHSKNKGQMKSWATLCEHHWILFNTLCVKMCAMVLKYWNEYRVHLRLFLECRLGSLYVLWDHISKRNYAILYTKNSWWTFNHTRIQVLTIVCNTGFYIEICLYKCLGDIRVHDSWFQMIETDFRKKPTSARVRGRLLKISDQKKHKVVNVNIYFTYLVLINISPKSVSEGVHWISFPKRMPIALSYENKPI